MLVVSRWPPARALAKRHRWPTPGPRRRRAARQAELSALSATAGGSPSSRGAGVPRATQARASGWPTSRPGPQNAAASPAPSYREGRGPGGTRPRAGAAHHRLQRRADHAGGVQAPVSHKARQHGVAGRARFAPLPAHQQWARTGPPAGRAGTGPSSSSALYSPGTPSAGHRCCARPPRTARHQAPSAIRWPLANSPSRPPPMSDQLESGGGPVASNTRSAPILSGPTTRRPAHRQGQAAKSGLNYSR